MDSSAPANEQLSKSNESVIKKQNEKQNRIKILAVTTSVVLLVTFILTIFTVFSWTYFWFIALLAGAVAYYFIPKMQEKAV